MPCGTGKVKILKDTDADGYPDQSVIFADSLVLPTGIGSKQLNKITLIWHLSC